jgi:hypothetical protein
MKDLMDWAFNSEAQMTMEGKLSQNSYVEDSEHG